MKALQVHYTSCRRGQSPSSGFQVRSCSAGLSPAELLEIARVGNYRPPVHAPGRPEPAPMPVALRYRRLQSGRYALIHSSYSGLDYSGREGNFMAHSLVPESGALSARATNFFGWNGWKLRLEDGEDTAELPPPLPDIELAPPPGDIDADRDFVRATNGEVVLANLMVALLLLPATSRRIVIRDRPDRGWRWIASLLDLLPLGSARCVTISTYQFDTADAADINATVEGSGFSLNATQRDFEFFVFEPEAGVSPNFPTRDPALLAEARQYADTIVRWYLNDHESFKAFQSFIETFKACPADRSLVTALVLFQASPSAQSTFGVELQRLVSFVRQHVLPDSFERSARLLYRLAESQPALTRFDGIHDIVRMCLDMKAMTDERASAGCAFAGWLALFGLALEDPDRYKTRVDQTWQLLAGQFDPAIGYRLLLSDKQMDVLRDCYRCANPATLEVLAPYLIKAVQSTAQGSGVEHPDIKEMALAAARGAKPRLSLAAILSAVGTVRGQRSLFAYLDDADPSLRPVLSECLLDLAKQNAAGAWTLRRELFESGLDDLLLAEFAMLVATGDKQAIYQNYLSEASVEAPKYHEDAQGDLASTYWRSLGGAERARQALDWLKARTLPVLDRSIAAELASCANEALSIGPAQASGALAQRIGEIARTESVSLHPDRPALVQMLRAIRENGESRPLLAASPDLFDGLRADEYAFAMETVLRREWSLAKGVEEQGGLIDNLHHPQLGRGLATIYARLVREALKAGKRGDLVAVTILAWIAHATASDPASRTAKLTLDGLADELASRPEDEIIDVFKRMRRAVNAAPEEDKAYYDDALAVFGERVRRGEASLTNTLRSIGHRLFEAANPFRRKN